MQTDITDTLSKLADCIKEEKDSAAANNQKNSEEVFEGLWHAVARQLPSKENVADNVW